MVLTSPYSRISLQTALQKQRDSIPYFSTKDRLNLRMDKYSEQLIIYDFEENQFYIMSWQLPDQTIFTPLAGGGSVTRLKTDFSLQTAVFINHNFGYYPTVQVFDASGDMIAGLIQNLNVNQTAVSFNQPMTGFILTY